jgi:hypothetical protein
MKNQIYLGFSEMQPGVLKKRSSLFGAHKAGLLHNNPGVFPNKGGRWGGKFMEL